jgi:hypothetical protein
MLQIVASLIDAARGVIYDRHMFIVQATGHHVYLPQDIAFPVFKKSDMISTEYQSNNEKSTSRDFESNFAAKVSKL